jgi:cell division septum initiation protein DivIVA
MCYMAAIPIALAALSTAQSVQSSRAQASAARQQAEVAREQAQVAATRMRSRGQSQLASARVGLARSGITPDGSPADVLSSAAAENEQSAQLTQWRGVAGPYGRADSGASQAGLRAATLAISQMRNLWS